MNNIKRVFGNFVKASDLLSHNVSLRYEGNSDYESYCTGIVSILAVSFFIVIFIIKFLTVLQLQDIVAFEHLTDNLESSQPISDIMFAMTIDGLGMTTIDKYFDFTVTQITQTKNSGSNGTKTKTERTIPLLPCKISYWQNMGIQNMQTLFEKRGMSAYYCPTQSFKIQGTSDEDIYIFAGIKLSPCASTNPFCQNNVTARDAYIQSFVNLNNYFTIKLMLKDSIISPTAESAVSNYIQKDILLTFSSTTGTIGYVQIADYEIQTDTNILPWSEYQKSTGYYVERFQTTTVPSTTKFLELKLEKSTRKFTVQRQFGKLDDMLSYVGGLFGLLFYCVQFVLQSYNEYRYELSVGESLFNYDDHGTQAKADEMGFWTYIKYSVYEWFDFFGVELSSWTSMKQIHETREQTNQQMDVRYLMQKIRHLQNVVQVLISEEQRLCLFLTELPTLNKIQKIRKVAEFYHSQKGPQHCNVDDKLSKEDENNESKKKLSHLNQSQFMLNNIVNQQFSRSPVKQTVQNQIDAEIDTENELANQVSEALGKILANQNDPINKKIIQRLKPGVLTRIQRSQTQKIPSNNNLLHLITLKIQEKMRRGTQ